MEKAVIYLRYSSDRQREESAEAQERICREFANRNGYVIVHVYADKELSGTSDDRKEFQAMMRDSRGKKFSTVICHKLDRFARSQYDYAIHKHALQQHKVAIRYADQDFGKSPEGVLVESFLAGLAEYYVRNLGLETRKGLDQNVINGKSTGGKLPYGYRRSSSGKVEIDERQAAVVRRIFDDKKSLTFEALSKKYKKPVSTLKSIINNTKYRGVGTFGTRSKLDKAPITFTFPAIITDEEAAS